MSETLEYIDAYFNQVLNTEQQKQFEERCSTDNGFAEEVAFYVMTRGAAREALLEEKQKQWKSTEAGVQKLFSDKPVKKSVLLRFAPYAVAACLLFAISYNSLFLSSPGHLASKYIKEYSDNQFKQTMDASKDSMQLGISEYNNGNYGRALALFEGVRAKDMSNSYAKINAGLAYLQMKDYDEALQRFRELSAMKDLHNNSGDMLQATTLLQRNNTGDKEEAKRLLEKVVQEKEEGNKEAQAILNKW